MMSWFRLFLGEFEAKLEESEDIYLEYIGSVTSVFG